MQRPYIPVLEYLLQGKRSKQYFFQFAKYQFCAVTVPHLAKFTSPSVRYPGTYSKCSGSGMFIPDPRSGSASVVSVVSAIEICSVADTDLGFTA